MASVPMWWMLLRIFISIYQKTSRRRNESNRRVGKNNGNIYIREECP